MTDNGKHNVASDSKEGEEATEPRLKGDGSPPTHFRDSAKDQSKGNSYIYLRRFIICGVQEVIS